MLGQAKATEQHRGIEEVARKRILKERNGRDVAGFEPGESPRVDAAEQPYAEVRDDEERNRTGDGGGPDAQRGTAGYHHHPDHDDHRPRGKDPRPAMIK